MTLGKEIPCKRSCSVSSLYNIQEISFPVGDLQYKNTYGFAFSLMSVNIVTNYNSCIIFLNLTHKWPCGLGALSLSLCLTLDYFKYPIRKLFVPSSYKFLPFSVIYGWVRFGLGLG